jgi:hypothetical protein
VTILIQQERPDPPGVMPLIAELEAALNLWFEKVLD